MSRLYVGNGIFNGDLTLHDHRDTITVIRRLFLLIRNLIGISTVLLFVLGSDAALLSASFDQFLFDPVRLVDKFIKTIEVLAGLAF